MPCHRNAVGRACKDDSGIIRAVTLRDDNFYLCRLSGRQYSKWWLEGDDGYEVGAGRPTKVHRLRRIGQRHKAGIVTTDGLATLVADEAGGRNGEDGGSLDNKSYRHLLARQGIDYATSITGETQLHFFSALHYAMIVWNILFSPFKGMHWHLPVVFVILLSTEGGRSRISHC